MKKTICIFLLITGSVNLLAQQDTTFNYVERIKMIPAIQIRLVTDSLIFSNDDIQKNSPFILMFFSPDCDHCQLETKEILAHREELKDFQILMVSVAQYQEIKDFYELFGLHSMPNIKLGQDKNFKLGTTYQIKTYPSIFVYDAKGMLAKAFVGNISIAAILDAVK